jgi:NADP-dependent aldehyde dehydrogenase
MPLSGSNYIGTRRVSSDKGFKAVNPATGETLATEMSSASLADVDAACELAWQAFPKFKALAYARRADFLEAIANEIMALGDELLERGNAESGLPIARLTGERGRTVGQLRLFAAEVRAGGWLGVRIDPALPDREPLPRPDLRQRKVPVGPVVVFGASNFPLAFSVAGGDTAAALAAGCPVIVKGHSAHPGTGELVAQAIVAAAKSTDMPDGVFSFLNASTRDVGGALVAHPNVRAVGFTGSRAGGLALWRIANDRPVPIPVYAEMSSINPVVLMPAALEARAKALGQAFIGSLTMGAGQFCTNPGLLLAIDGPALNQFLEAAGEALGGASPATMLTSGIYEAYAAGVKRLESHDKIELLARGIAATGVNCGTGALFAVRGADLAGNPEIMDEVFGAAGVVVRCRDEDEVLRVLEGLEGQLTATLQMDDADTDFAQRCLPILERKAGRVIANGWPTGVDVCHAMVHGGPFPATSDGRSTSVGTLAIERFLRPVCYQDLPEALLPDELRGDGSGVPRRYDGDFKVS